MEKIFRTSFMGYDKKDVIEIIYNLNKISEQVEKGEIPPEYAETHINSLMIVGMKTSFGGFDKKTTDKYIAELISRITGKEYSEKYKPDYIKPTKTFFKDTWKIMLAISIVTASLLYGLIFDGSSIPFAISFAVCDVLFIIDTTKGLIKAVKEKSLLMFLFWLFFLAHAVYFLISIFIGGNSL